MFDHEEQLDFSREFIMNLLEKADESEHDVMHVLPTTLFEMARVFAVMMGRNGLPEETVDFLVERIGVAMKKVLNENIEDEEDSFEVQTTMLKVHPNMTREEIYSKLPKNIPEETKNKVADDVFKEMENKKKNKKEAVH